MKKTLTFPGYISPWETSFSLREGAEDTDTVFSIKVQDTPLLLVSCSAEGIVVKLYSKWEAETKSFGQNPSFEYLLTSPQKKGNVEICWLDYAVRLYVNGQLEDEEWPLGTLKKGEWKVEFSDHVENFLHNAVKQISQESTTYYKAPFQNFVLPGHNTGVGDCMPFARDGEYCLYYLFDRRGHASKNHLGAHQWAQVSSKDLKNWTVHPMSVGITHQWEGSICTGSLIQKEGKTYAFYAVRMSDGSPARMTWAVSDNGIHFEKSNQYFALTHPYEPVSARDPMVFCDEKGLCHMLVTTSLVEKGTYGGCLAHLTSIDLMNWTQLPPFIVPGYADQPECSDYFEWNGWYYLVFSNFASARYRMSRSPLGPWLRPENDFLDAKEVQVPKTAAFQNRRFSTGFLARRPRTYAGNAVTHELFQHSDGTLGIKHLEEILPEGKEVFQMGNAFIEGGEGRALFSFPEKMKDFRLKATLVPKNKGVLIGLVMNMNADNEQDTVLAGNGEKAYRIDIDPAAGRVSITRPGENFIFGAGGNSRDAVENMKNLQTEIKIDLIVMGDILDLVFGDGRVITMRLDEKAEQGIKVAVFAMAGTVELKDTVLQKLQTS